MCEDVNTDWSSVAMSEARKAQKENGQLLKRIEQLEKDMRIAKKKITNLEKVNKILLDDIKGDMAYHSGGVKK